MSYETRRRTKAGQGRRSRVDRRRTRVGFLAYRADSDSDDSALNTGSDGDSDEVEDEHNGDPAAVVGDEKNAANSSEEDEACAASRSGRKRSAVLVDSSSDSGSDFLGRPVRHVLPKKRQNLQIQLSDSDTDTDNKQPEKDERTDVKQPPGSRGGTSGWDAEVSGFKSKHRRQEAAAKREERKAKLLELSRKRRARSSSAVLRALGDSDEGNVEDEDDDEEGTCALVHSSEETDSNSLKDFIVEDEKQEDGEDEEDDEAQGRSLLSQHFPQMALGSQMKHFQVVVKALLINAFDQTFLKSLYDGVRKKRYAEEMKNSLYHLDQRSVTPRLENLKQRSRWSERYKERVECYPRVQVFMTGGRDRPCDACELHRHTRFHVHLSGQLYDSKTLQEDTFMPNDKQVFSVGNVCARRTEVYHQLKHYKYHLFRRCQEKLKKEEEEEEEEPVKERVERMLSRLQSSGWIREQYEKFQDHLNQADFFQEEKLG